MNGKENSPNLWNFRLSPAEMADFRSVVNEPEALKAFLAGGRQAWDLIERCANSSQEGLILAAQALSMGEEKHRWPDGGSSWLCDVIEPIIESQDVSPQQKTAILSGGYVRHFMRSNKAAPVLSLLRSDEVPLPLKVGLLTSRLALFELIYAGYEEDVMQVIERKDLPPDQLFELLDADFAAPRLIKKGLGGRILDLVETRGMSWEHKARFLSDYTVAEILESMGLEPKAAIIRSHPEFRQALDEYNKKISRPPGTGPAPQF